MQDHAVSPADGSDAAIDRHKPRRLHTVTMVRENLSGIVPSPLPAAFTVRPYRDQRDRQNWLEIHHLADQYQPATEAHFVRSYGQDEGLFRQRLFFVDRADETIGTGAAWFGDAGTAWACFGRIHWVAVVPRYQSSGVGRGLLTHLLRTLQTLGHKNAYLTTDHVRLPAIGMYTKFGFSPHTESQADRRLWDGINQHLATGDQRA